MTATGVPFRLVRNGDSPATNPLHLVYIFGLQDTKQTIAEGVRRADGTFVFDISLKAKLGPEPQRPVFTGRLRVGRPRIVSSIMAGGPFRPGKTSTASKRGFRVSIGLWVAQLSPPAIP